MHVFFLFLLILDNVDYQFSVINWLYVTLNHKTSHKGKFIEIEMYTLSES